MKAKLILGLLLLLPVLIYVAQNSEAVPVRFLAWEFSLSLALLLFAVLLIGFVSGFLCSGLLRLRRTGRGTPPTAAP